MTRIRHPTTGKPAASASALTPADLVRGGAAFLALLIGLVAVPLLLAGIAGSPLPEGVPSVAEFRSALIGPDDGTLFVQALVLLGWAGWSVKRVWPWPPICQHPPRGYKMRPIKGGPNRTCR